jgi:hypothetical protein
MNVTIKFLQIAGNGGIAARGFAAIGFSSRWNQL